MRFVAFHVDGRPGLAVQDSAGSAHGLMGDQPGYPGSMDQVLLGGREKIESAGAALRAGGVIDLASVSVAVPFPAPGKIICVGLNYRDHAAESGLAQPENPVLFTRLPSSLVAHGEPIVRPSLSDKLDYEGELVAVIGVGGRHIARESALDHVAGYSIFNDGSIRDFQLRTSQWTMGKNFDGTGAFGPVFVTADELPPGATGLRLETRLNGEVMQSASTDDLLFDIATLVSAISEGITLAPGDVIVTGTPSGVGAARKPPVFMKPGDVCEVEIERIGVLRNPIVQEA